MSSDGDGGGSTKRSRSDYEKETAQDDVRADLVKLNVGGVRYTVARSTLATAVGTILCRLVTDEVGHGKDEQGHIWIDRDGDLFPYILNFIRSSATAVPLGVDRYALKQEAEFFGLIDLVKILEEEDPIVTINVSGTEFKVMKETFTHAARGNLARSIISRILMGDVEAKHPFAVLKNGDLFFDADPVVFSHILRYFRTPLSGRWRPPPMDEVPYSDLIHQAKALAIDLPINQVSTFFEICPRALQTLENSDTPPRNLKCPGCGTYFKTFMQIEKIHNYQPWALHPGSPMSLAYASPDDWLMLQEHHHPNELMPHSISHKRDIKRSDWFYFEGTCPSCGFRMKAQVPPFFDPGTMYRRGGGGPESLAPPSPGRDETTEGSAQRFSNREGLEPDGQSYQNYI